MNTPAYKRILLKLSGEILAGNRGYGIDPDVLSKICNKIIKLKASGLQIGIVIGGGNIFRGIQAASKGMQRVTGDYLGMLATIMNAVCVQDALESLGSVTRTLSAITVAQIAEPYIRRKSIRHLEKKRVVVFAAGTGNPHMTTDTAASLRAIEIEAEILLMAKFGVDGVYSEDPKENKSATKYDTITYQEALTKKLRVMDSTALALCMDNNLPIVVFDLFKKGNLKNIILGEKQGTLLSNS